MEKLHAVRHDPRAAAGRPPTPLRPQALQLWTAPAPCGWLGGLSPAMRWPRRRPSKGKASLSLLAAPSRARRDGAGSDMSFIRDVAHFADRLPAISWRPKRAREVARNTLPVAKVARS